MAKNEISLCLTANPPSRDDATDQHHPYNWTYRKKAWAVGLGLLASLVAAPNGTILTVAHVAIDTEFFISDAHFQNSYWPTAAWGLGGVLSPLLVFPLLEDIGVRPVFLSTYLIFTAMLAPIGFAPNFATLIALRFFTGACVQVLCNVSAGIIANVFRTERERSVPVALYVTVYLAGTSLGPVIGATILQNLESWRWIGHMEVIWTAVLFPLFIFGMPESRASAVLKSSSAVHGSRFSQFWRIIFRPLYMLGTEAVVIAASLWAAFSLGTIYLFTQSTEQVFTTLYGWDAVQAGYLQTAIVVGEILGGLFCCLCTPQSTPEARLYPAISGALLGVTGGMFVYAWTATTVVNDPWPPMVGLAMVGFGTVAAIIGNANYLVDAYGEYAASALGAVTMVENLAVAFLPLAEQSMYSALGFTHASSLLAAISLLIVAAPVTALWYGPAIRARSPYVVEQATQDEAARGTEVV